MKRLLISILCFLPLALMAKSNDDSKYLSGAVPEENGQICFKKSFRVPNKSAQEIKQTLEAWAQRLVDESISAPGNYARMMENTDNHLVARVCEWLVFKKKALNLDRTRFRYQLEVNVDGNRVTLAANQLYYYYGEDMDGYRGELFKAEEWISDKEALNKSKTKLYPKSAKFRRKTVDRMEELFDSAMDAFEIPEPKIDEVKKPVRKAIIED